MASDGNRWDLNDDMSDVDPEMYEILRNEKQRQRTSLEMVASENFAGKAVLQALSSCLSNKDSEGHVGQRFATQFGNTGLGTLDLLTLFTRGSNCIHQLKFWTVKDRHHALSLIILQQGLRWQ